MAKIYPFPFPNDLPDHTAPASEKKLYRHLAESGLHDDFHCFYSVPWIHRDTNGRVADGEVDFIIIHKDYSVLLIEIKGGGISRKGGEWFSTDRNGHVHSIHNPITQLQRSRGHLLPKLRNLKGIGNDFIPMGYALAFPDTKRGTLGDMDIAEDLILFGEDFTALESRILKMFEYWQSNSNESLGAQRVTRLKSYFYQEHELKSPLGIHITDIENQILKLSTAQLATLRLLKKIRRAQVIGGAGTGKTVLAIEKAKQLSAEGFKTLVSCYNDLLAEHLSKILDGDPNIVVMNFHKLCEHYGKLAKLPMANDGSRTYFDEVLPQILEQALDKTDFRFDAIVIDEGQDFKAAWWDIIQLTLKNPADDVLYVFHDENQRVGDSEYHIPSDLVPFCLDKNFRNTVEIHSFAAHFVKDSEVEVIGVSGLKPTLITATSTDELKVELRKLLNKLIVEEKVPPGKIAILTGGSFKKSAIAIGDEFGQYHLSKNPSGPQDILFETVRRFKGLERSVVLVIEIDAQPDTVKYVAFSRAIANLSIFTADPKLYAHAI